MPPERAKKSFTFIHCYVNDSLGPYGLFVGMSLAAKQVTNKNDLSNIRDSLEFEREVSDELEKFANESPEAQDTLSFNGRPLHCQN